MEIINKKQKNLLLACGIPGSGKSTWLAQQRDICVISRDQCRFALLKPGDDYFAHEKEVLSRFYHFIADGLNNTLKPSNICADATHLTTKARQKTLNSIDKSNVNKIIALSFETPLEVAIERNAARTGREKVPKSVIENMSHSWTIPTLDEGFDEIWHIDADGGVRKEVKE